jgi:hypothetical protein
MPGNDAVESVNLFLRLVAPSIPGTTPEVLDVRPDENPPGSEKHPDEPVLLNNRRCGLTWTEGAPNTVSFDAPGVDVVPELVRKANQAEIDSGLLFVGPVRLRPVLYCYAGRPPGPGVRCGGGVARGRIQVTARMGRGIGGQGSNISRVFTVERMFSVMLNDTKTAWLVDVQTDPWRTEAIDE